MQKCKRSAPTVGNEHVPIHRGAVVPCPKGGLSESSGICGSTVSSLVFRIVHSVGLGQRPLVCGGSNQTHVETWGYSKEHINRGRAEIHATDRTMGNSHPLMLHPLLRRTSEWAAGLWADVGDWVSIR